MLEKLKLLLGIEVIDKSLDDKLLLILSTVTARLSLLIGGDYPPESMDHIILEVAVIRFNRIGSEGMSTHTVEGESLTFADSDFDGFQDEIRAFLESKKENARGRLQFL